MIKLYPFSNRNSSRNVKKYVKNFYERYQISHWDGLILAAAKEAHCEILYSEDLQHGQIYGGITILNPFTEKSQI